ncbi:hypothetical protein [Piscinibacter terrae]|uniref:Uncharacterized protein n=1 Tax=Piscinibacter terrae TaxID=2496871 RepID=A0A3N7JR14_9BURK|nr:hypothetical protein [Albitalea terrae]RQP21485.1 hypothetical protein DZC73_26555 [Albitalea terrae]
MSSASAIVRAQQALDAGRRARIVGHAKLMPACDDDAAQMRFAVEDALNTADFGDAGRLVLVRRLRLAALPPRASPALVARAMETAWRAAALRAVPAVHPSAGRSEAVFFASRFEARMAWLAKVAGGEVPAAWFWSAALPELKAVAAMPVSAAIECVMESALQGSEPAVAGALKRWPDAALVALVRGMPAVSHRRLLQVLTSSAHAQRSAPVATLVARVRAAKALPPPLAIVARRLSAWAPMDEAPANLLAALWLEPVLRRMPSMDEVLAVASRAVWMAGQSLAMPAVGEGSAQAQAGVAEKDAPQVHALDEPTLEARAGASAADPTRQRADTGTASRPEAWKIESGLTPQPQPRVKARAARAAFQPSWPWLVDAAFTRCGGLMLVLNVLAALRFDRRLQGVEASERRRLVQALLLCCLDVAKAPEDEPQRAWLDAPPHPSLRLWTLRLRRTLRRHARMDLADLVRRPAWVSATPTHIDVVFAMDDVDMRLRRLGLDADPGWVPWFGRIVNFHFIDAGLLPVPEEDVRG